MLKKLSEQLKWEPWASKSPRYKRLTVLDRLLDGTFYDDLPFAFFDEEDNGDYVPLDKRRPSVQYNVPSYIAKTTARKLFAGTHAPKIIHPDPKIEEKLKTLINSTNLFYYMLQAGIWGSVGSVALTFKIVDNNYLIEVWRARFCYPQFSADGKLQSLRIAYLSSDWPLGDKDAEGEDIIPNKSYWFVRDLDANSEINYKPILDVRWNPIDGKPAFLVQYPQDNKTGPLGEVKHNLGFIPAQWIVNLAGGEFPDGASTFAPAIGMSIELDYTMSQIGRGVRYNTAPQLVLKGEPINMGDDDEARLTRSPATTIQFKATVKDLSGATMEGGDAHLLEMTGSGVKAGLDYVTALRKLALETVAAARKDPERAKGPLSGKAMETLDDQFVDLVQELRSSFGDTGMLSLIKKMVRAGMKVKHELFSDMNEAAVDSIGVVWKRAIPTPPEALVQVASAIETLVKNDLLDEEDARKYVHMALDLDALDAQQAISNVMVAEPRDEPTPDAKDGPNIFQTAPYPGTTAPQKVEMGLSRRRKR